MQLPDDFAFSQSSLQDFVDCPRRFLLRYVQHLQWPALASVPALEFERITRLGTDFHRLVHQHQLGLPLERLAAQIDDEQLQAWWQNYLEYGQSWSECASGSDCTRLPEYLLAGELTGNLTGDLAGIRLVAKLDLLLRLPDGRFRILDWKTYQNRPTRTWLAARLQTRLYPALLLLAGTYLNNGIPIQPEQVELVYWFSSAPQQPERFPYSASQHQENLAYVAGLIQRIQSASEPDFFLTQDENACRFCVYRSLCDRGAEAGALPDLTSFEADASEFIELDFDQIGEIEF